MRIGNVLQGRPDYYDRNPINQTNEFTAAGLGPHGATTRWSYVVPSNRKAYLQVLQLKVLRASAAAPVATYSSYITLDPTGAAPAIQIATALSKSNNVPDQDKINLSGAGLLLAGDTLTGLTIDLSTGGTVDYYSETQIVEFDV